MFSKPIFDDDNGQHDNTRPLPYVVRFTVNGPTMILSTKIEDKRAYMRMVVCGCSRSLALIILPNVLMTMAIVH